MATKKGTDFKETYKKYEEKSLIRTQGYSTTPEQREANRKRLLQEFGKKK